MSWRTRSHIRLCISRTLGAAASDEYTFGITRCLARESNWAAHLANSSLSSSGNLRSRARVGKRCLGEWPVKVLGWAGVKDSGGRQSISLNAETTSAVRAGLSDNSVSGPRKGEALGLLAARNK